MASDVLGIFLLIVFVVCVVSFAASVTWLVVKLTPKKTQTKPPAA